jgi:hypothetical protein
MSAIAENAWRLRVERTNKPSKPRGSHHKPDDIVLLAELRPIIDKRPNYGYRRVTALLNRQRRRDGLPTVNAKRVLRVMQQNGLTLQKHTARRPARAHDGVVVALSSNIRWCSDHLEICARNGEVVRIVFVIDACDREIIALSAVANVGICGEMVCDLMIAAVERRFKTLKVPYRLEWLSDNGSAYRQADRAGRRCPRHRGVRWHRRDHDGRRQGGSAPTPAVSHVILSYNRGRTGGMADGVITTPSHNSPADGGIKYIPPHGGPAGATTTGAIERIANEFLKAGLAGVRRIPYERALSKSANRLSCDGSRCWTSKKAVSGIGGSA